METLRNCHDCGAKPGEVHAEGCDTERCSVCGGQYLSCGCEGHDRAFARWTGLWPGFVEAASLGLTLNDLYDRSKMVNGKLLSTVFFVKPEDK